MKYLNLSFSYHIFGYDSFKVILEMYKNEKTLNETFEIDIHGPLYEDKWNVINLAINKSEYRTNDLFRVFS